MKPVVAHVITGLNTGGAELMLSRLVERHADSAFTPIVICLTDEGPVADTIRSFGISVHNLGMSRGIPDPIVVTRLVRLLRREKVSVVQTWLYHADLIGGLGARGARVPVAWGVHQSKLDEQTASRSLKLVVRTCARISRFVPAAIVCCAEASRTAHIAHGYDRHRIRVIPNGFDVSRFAPDLAARAEIRAELEIAPDTVVIGIAGRFVPLKNHGLFVEAAGLLAATHENVAFVMAGEGLDHANDELAGWINAAGITDKVHLLGRRSDMNRVLAALDVCALTSRTEAFPMVLGEAMATGVPCVSTDVGDAALLIGETGRVVPPGDPVAMATAFAELVEMSPTERTTLGNQARARMVSDFDIAYIAKRYDQLWIQLARGEFVCE